MKMSQRGGFVLGLVVGLLAGLALALGVALYITKAPVPFVNKVPQRTAEQDNAETERNKNWDPNGPLGGRSAVRPAIPAAPAASGSGPAVSPPPLAAASGAAARPAAPARDPAAILSGATFGSAASTAAGPQPFVYFVQAGAYTRSEEAEQQRAKLALVGLEAKVSEREQSGRTVYRVRVGPYEAREDADGVQGRLSQAGIDARLVRVERQ
ncbi:SPOR domain-containing protein [Rubrivivax sp. RP6-9]|uniref:SPOR domain-containing protein n=1 Tax=Rubrivivax sp. RP6-9 TaxID=3415750 RepID=UPI003CC56791